MKLSTKGRYAMVALSDIAMQPADKLVSLWAIYASRQDISLPYLEQLFVKLRRADLGGVGARARWWLPVDAVALRNPRVRYFGGRR